MNTTEVADHVIGMKNADNQEQLADAAVALITKSHDNVMKSVAEVKAEIAEVKAEVKAEVAKVEDRSESRHRWVIGLILALAGLMVAMRVFPPAPVGPQAPLILQIPANPQVPQVSQDPSEP